MLIKNGFSNKSIVGSLEQGLSFGQTLDLLLDIHKKHGHDFFEQLKQCELNSLSVSTYTCELGAKNGVVESQDQIPS